jgi:hypothetical protein
MVHQCILKVTASEQMIKDANYARKDFYCR